MRSEAFSPSHITGFFSAFSRGSTGAGLSISLGVRTRVEVLPYHRNRFEVYINGMPDRAPTSMGVLRRYSRLFRRPIWAKVKHLIELPIGFGLGTSGAGALSLSLAMNEALGLPLGRKEAGGIAHEGELEAKTGLGTVVSEYYGGFEMRVKPSGPGEGGLIKLPVKKGYKVVCIALRPIKTKDALANRELLRRINALGSRLLEEFKRKPRLEEFIRLSRIFSEEVMPKNGQDKLIKELDSRGYRPSLAIFGITPFIVTDEAEQVARVISKLGYSPFVADIDERGARLV